MSHSSGPHTPAPPISVPPPEHLLHPLLKAEAAGRLRRQINSVAWGLFFVWLGVVWFAALDWYWGMVGVGLIFLGEAVIEGARDLKISGVSVMFGMLFLAGGVWGLSTSPFALLPALFVLFGIAMVWRAAAGILRRD